MYCNTTFYKRVQNNFGKNFYTISLVMENLRAKKIVIIDDEIDWCLLMKSHLSKWSYNVHCFHSLKDAFPAIFDIKPDILFLDNNLPDGTGWDKAAELIEKIPGIQVNLISAFRSHLPQLPSKKNARLWEKPISIKDLDAYLSVR